MVKLYSEYGVSFLLKQEVVDSRLQSPMAFKWDRRGFLKSEWRICMQLSRLLSDWVLWLVCVMLFSEAGGVWVVAFVGLVVLWGATSKWGCWFSMSRQKIKLVFACVCVGGGSSVWLKRERTYFSWGARKCGISKEIDWWLKIFIWKEKRESGWGRLSWKINWVIRESQRCSRSLELVRWPGVPAAYLP